MPRKRIGIVVLVATVTATAIASLVSASRSRRGQTKQPVFVMQQLPAVSGTVPVEIRNLNATFPKSNEVQDVTCITRNNTDKAITSLVLNYTIVTVNHSSGRELGDRFVLYREAFVHPDVREAHHYKPLGPGEEFTFESSGIAWFENAIVKRIEARIDFVEFEDSTKLGPDEKGSQIIGELRQGAVIYKNWLVQRYRENGSVGPIIPLLQTPDLPKQLALDGMYLQEGAQVYRNHMLKVFNSYGGAELEKYLNR